MGPSCSAESFSDDAACHLDAKRQLRDVKQQVVVRLLVRSARNDGRLDSITVGNSLVRVDRLVRLLLVEEVLQQLDNLGNPRRPAKMDNLVDRPIVMLRVQQDTLTGVIVCLNWSMHSSSNSAREIDVKLTLSYRWLTLADTFALDDRFHFARSHAVRSRPTASAFLVLSFLYFRSNSLLK